MKFFKKIQKQKIKRLRELGSICGAMAIVLLACMPNIASAFTLYVSSYSATPNPVPSGQKVTISWSVPNADDCYFTATPALGGIGYSDFIGDHGSKQSTTVVTAQTQVGMLCENTGSASQGYTNPQWQYITISVASDNCPATPTAVSGGLQVPAGTYHIVAQGSDFCVTNNSGKSLFVPTNSATELNNFKSAIQGYLASTVAYFGRAPGY